MASTREDEYATWDTVMEGMSASQRRAHDRGTRRARVCLASIPVLCLLVSITRPLYASYIDVFGPGEGRRGHTGPSGGFGAGPSRLSGIGDTGTSGAGVRLVPGSLGGAATGGGGWGLGGNGVGVVRAVDDATERRRRLEETSRPGPHSRDGDAADERQHLTMPT